jgi:RND family efflux transporter MFP subunit
VWVALAALALSGGCNKGAGKAKSAEGEKAGYAGEPVTVSVAAAGLKAVSFAIEMSGTVVPDGETRILPKVTGRLISVVDEWTTVRAGQELARVDTPELTWQLQQGRAAVATAKAGVDLAVANRANADDTFRRVKEQLAAGAANQQQYDQAFAAHRVARAQVEQARAQFSQAQAGAKVIETQAASARITAPVSGVVTQRLLDVGGMANPAQPLLVLAHAGRRLVKATVSERDLRFLAAGMRADVASVAFPGRSFAGRLSEISPALDVQSRTVAAKIRLEDGEALKFGMSVTVRLRPDARKGIVVPATAVQSEGAGNALYLAADGKAKRVPVEVGVRMGQDIEIRSGLRAGDPVIVRGGDFLRDGVPIRVGG